MGNPILKITADTNILVRATVQDDPVQAQAASRALADATLISVPLPTLCELVWVLRRAYKVKVEDVATAIQSLVTSENVVTDRPAVDAGMAQLEAGGDFADGVIAYQGAMLGGDVFMSFDQSAVAILRTEGKQATVPD